MYDKLPNERQIVEVHLENRDWQQATYMDGEFFDVHGMPLDPYKIDSWRGANGKVIRRHASVGKSH
jgi:hypothetical protein